MNRIGIIGGAGIVGSTVAFALLLKNADCTIVLVDKNIQKCNAQVEDLSDAATVKEGFISVRNGTYKDLAICNIIIITAGVKQPLDMTDAELLQINRKIIIDIMQKLTPFLTKKSIIIVVTNPVDPITSLVLQLSGLSVSQVFGTGTSLDTLRLHHELQKIISIPSKYIGAYVLGEHDGKQFVNWEDARVFDQTHLETLHEMRIVDKTAVEERVRYKANNIIEGKGFTQFGIAAITAEICQSVIQDKCRVHPVSHYLPKYGCCLSLPAIIGKVGVENTVAIDLSLENMTVLRDAADHVHEQLNKL
jgi:L-lactate dehydrogenase